MKTAVDSQVCVSIYRPLLLVYGCCMFLTWLVVGWLLGYVHNKWLLTALYAKECLLEHSCLYLCVILGPNVVHNLPKLCQTKYASTHLCFVQ